MCVNEAWYARAGLVFKPNADRAPWPCRVQNTRVANSNVLPFVDTITVPVKEVFEQLRGPGATKALVEVRRGAHTCMRRAHECLSF